jgi:CRP-like cAMP-binding protein
MIERLLTYLTKFAPLEPRDTLTLATAEIATRSLRAREDILRAGDHPHEMYCLLSGVAYRHSLLLNGRREITALLLPGDIIGLESLMPWACVDTVTALMPMQCAQIPARVAAAWIEHRSPISVALWRIRELQASIYREWIINIGTRPAIKRIAHFFCETLTRSRALGICNGIQCSVPLTQIELADITAVTPVHVNRILMQLRRDNLAHFKHGYLEVPSFSALRTLTGFDPAYLEPLRAPPEGTTYHQYRSAQQRPQTLRSGAIVEIEHAP